MNPRALPRRAPPIACGVFALALVGCSHAPSPGDAADAGGLDADATTTDVQRLVPMLDARVGEPDGCNGLRSSCGLSYDRVAIAATHDAFAYASGGSVRYLFPNQDRPIPEQLAAGIRGLGLRPCPYFGSDPTQTNRVYVTHNSALRGALGTEPLDGILAEIKSFLDANPREIVSLYMESSVTVDQVASTFTAAGLGPYLFAYDPARGWPTLDAMIASGQRLVAFNDSQDTARPPWMLYLYDFIVDTDYNVTDASQFSCAFYRGVASNPIYYLNQFIYQDEGADVVVPSEANARIANASDFVLARAHRCLAEVGRRASVVYVDWYGQGDVVGAVETLNREYAADGGM